MWLSRASDDSWRLPSFNARSSNGKNKGFWRRNVRLEGRAKRRQKEERESGGSQLRLWLVRDRRSQEGKKPRTNERVRICEVVTKQAQWETEATATVFLTKRGKKEGTDRENWEGGGGWSLVAKLWLGGGDCLSLCVCPVKDSGKSEGEALRG